LKRSFFFINEVPAILTEGVVSATSSPAVHGQAISVAADAAVAAATTVAASVSASVAVISVAAEIGECASENSEKGNGDDSGDLHCAEEFKTRNDYPLFIYYSIIKACLVYANNAVFCCVGLIYYRNIVYNMLIAYI